MYPVHFNSIIKMFLLFIFKFESVVIYAKFQIMHFIKLEAMAHIITYGYATVRAPCVLQALVVMTFSIHNAMLTTFPDG